MCVRYQFLDHKHCVTAAGSCHCWHYLGMLGRWRSWWPQPTFHCQISPTIFLLYIHIHERWAKFSMHYRVNSNFQILDYPRNFRDAVYHHPEWVHYWTNRRESWQSPLLSPFRSVLVQGFSNSPHNPPTCAWKVRHPIFHSRSYEVSLVGLHINKKTPI